MNNTNTIGSIGIYHTYAYNVQEGHLVDIITQFLLSDPIHTSL